MWKNASVESVKLSLEAIRSNTESFKAELAAAHSDAKAADTIRLRAAKAKLGVQWDEDAKDLPAPKGTALSDDDDDILLLALVATPFTKMNIRNVMCKFLDHVHPDAEIRKASSEARVELTKIKRGFFAREDIYNAVAPSLNRIAKQTDNSGALARGLLKKFYHIGLFHLSDPKVRGEVQALYTEISATESAWKDSLQDYVSNFSLELPTSQLAGVPEHVLETMKVKEGGEGVRQVTLTYPHVNAILEFCTVRDTREKLYHEFRARGGKENEDRLLKIAQLRHKVANLQGKPTFAHIVQSQNRMAGDVSRVLNFLSDLASRTERQARQEVSDLAAFAKTLGIDELRPWDKGFVLALYQEKMLALNSKEVNEYFPADHVLPEVLAIYEKLLGLKFTRADDNDTWHQDVQVWHVHDFHDASFLGKFYLDLWPRPGKYGHACVINMSNTPYGGSRKAAIDASTMLCNLSKQLSHDDVVTFFHEFGHVMHNICGALGSKSPYAKVPRDFVEAPSQMLENWCWDASVISRLSKHHLTGERMPEDMVKKLQSSRFFLALQAIRRQLYLNQFDQMMHGSDVPSSTQEMAARERRFAQELNFTEVSDKLSGLGRNFGHTASQYSASYYGYLWSEVFSADMFVTCFGSSDKLTDPTVGRHYRSSILHPGGLEKPDELLRRFLGREVQMTAFLQQHGIEEDQHQDKRART